MAWFDESRKEYKATSLREQMEVLTLSGDLTLTTDGRPIVHTHVVLGSSDGHAWGGHLIEATASPTLELYATTYPEPLHKRLDPPTDLLLIDPSLRLVAARHSATAAQIALAWLLTRPAISSVIIAARTNERLAENIHSVDLSLDGEDLEILEGVSAPAVAYPGWMVEQLDLAEDPRSRTLNPDRFASGRVRDRRGTRWEPR
jgi:Plants and Prokaryotes Conserved (PCC) domain/Aldo/keto reductase family